jgi:hypothetical protein
MAELSDESSPSESPVDAAPDSAAAAAAAAAAPAGFSEEALRTLCRILELPADGPSVDPNRVMELASVLAEFVLPLYQLTWATWRTLAPNSPIRRTGNLQRSLTGFVGSGEVSREQLSAELHRLRQMTASLVAAVGQVGHHMTSSYLSRFQPAEIEQVIDAEGGGGLFKGRAGRCWQKYLELSSMLEHGAVEGEIRRAIVQHVEQLMKGSVPPPSERGDSGSSHGGGGGGGTRASQSVGGSARRTR